MESSPSDVLLESEEGLNLDSPVLETIELDAAGSGGEEEDKLDDIDISGLGSPQTPDVIESAVVSESKGTEVAAADTSSSGEATSSGDTSAAVAASSSSYTPVRFDPKNFDVTDVEGHFSIEVKKPEKTEEGYVRYSVATKTTLEDFGGTEFLVQRRYNDFVWIHEQLSKANRDVIIPPLPGKSLTTPDAQFLEVRRRGLEVFLQRCTSHPALYKAAELQKFLTANEAELKVAQEAKPTSSVVSKVGGFFSSAFASLASQAAPETFGATETDPWFENQGAYNEEMAAAISKMAQVGSSISGYRNNLARALQSFAKASKKLEEAEKKAEGGGNPDTFKRFSEVATQAAQLQSQLSQAYKDKLSSRLRDYQRYFEAAKDLLDYRFEILDQYQSASKTVVQKKEQLQKVPAGKPTDDIEKAIEKAEANEQEKKELYHKVEASCHHEIERFEMYRARNFRSTLTDIAQAHVDHELQVLDLWKSLLSEISEN